METKEERGFHAGCIGGASCNSPTKRKFCPAKSTRMSILSPSARMKYSGWPKKRHASRCEFRRASTATGMIPRSSIYLHGFRLAMFSNPTPNARVPQHIPDFVHNTARPPKYGQHTRRSFAFRIQRLCQRRDAATAAKATLAAAIVEAMSSSLWAADMNPASYCDGAR